MQVFRTGTFLAEAGKLDLLVTNVKKDISSIFVN